MRCDFSALATLNPTATAADATTAGTAVGATVDTAGARARARARAGLDALAGLSVAQAAALRALLRPDRVLYEVHCGGCTASFACCHSWRGSKSYEQLPIT